jgi:GDPmannose 4,6-dehydratase
VTRKITRGLARIKAGLQDCVFLGNLDAKRDWGHARDYVEMQWMMLQQPLPEDFVIATGQQYSVREFVNAAAREMGMTLTWQGKGLEERALDPEGECRVAVDPRYFRPAEVDSLVGDASKARIKLGWKPKVTFRQLVAEMVATDFQEASRDRLVHESGYRIYKNQD